MHQTDVVIIGAGPVGLFAIFQCGMVGLKTHVFDGLSHVGGQCSALYPTKPIYDIPAYPSILAQELVDQLYAQAKPFHPTFHFQNKIIKIEENPDQTLTIESDQGIQVQTKALIIAAGVGAFGPNRPLMPSLERYEAQHVHYFVRDPSQYRDKTLVIAGGGDSAVDWALNLAPLAKKIHVIHRRNKFRASPHSQQQLTDRAQQDDLDLHIPYQLHDLKGTDGGLTHVIIQNIETHETKELEADFLLPFFGLSTNLGPIHDWGLGICKNAIDVDPTTAKTNKNNIYAIGDIATYPHKLKLILTGFSEAAYAAHAIYRSIHPDQPLHFEHSTTKGIPGIKS